MTKVLVFILLFTTVFLRANKPPSEIYVDLQKLHSLKRVLYIAAHPDDENTRALSYFSLGEKAETAYLSLTRGDGGQNLIGNELSEKLGLLRTQELLAARTYDKANQFFTRAVDFGYSKSAEESFEKWGKDELLADVVLIIRQFKPDVIITRFPPDKRGGHGHHTASAILAIEAFSKAADPTFLPEQVKEFGVWKSTSIYWNTSSWWDETLPEKSKGDPKYLVKDIGGYNQQLGKSYNEIGTIARSQHKCQGFGAIIERGSRIEYFEHLGGDLLKEDFFEKNNSSWGNLLDQNFQKEIDELVGYFDFVKPANNLDRLISIRKGLKKLPDSRFKEEKLYRCDQIIRDCIGLYVECLVDDYAFVYGSKKSFKLSMLNRSNKSVVFKGFTFGMADTIYVSNDTLTQGITIEKSFEMINNLKISNLYWLESKFDNLFTVKDKNMLGKAENESFYSYECVFSIDTEEITFNIPVIYKWREPSYGERKRKLITTPSYSTNFEKKLTLLKAGQEKKLKVKVHAFADSLDTKIQIRVPNNWEVEPKEFIISTSRKHEELFLEITIKANETCERGALELLDENGNQLFSYTEIVYNHIPTQVIFEVSEIECIKLDAKIKQGKVAYIKGIKDAVPNGIRELGFDLGVFEVEELSDLDLNQFQTVVLGIRVYNVKPELKNFDAKLFAYVEQGGNLIMQYNTASRWVKSKEYGPKPFKLGSKRVTEENAEVVFLEPEHPILNTPNKIMKADFDNWVQERGLYFAETWDKQYIPIFSWHDKGEKNVKGAMIVLKHGKGQFIYTGISFFRELPNGVEGAFKLFANLLSY